MSMQGSSNAKKPVSASPVAASKPANGTTASHANVEVKPNLEAVRKRAYELYLERAKAGKPGNDRTDWLQAEKELAARK